MNEERKSFWKKTRKGPLWRVLIIAAIVTFSISVVTIGRPLTRPEDYGAASVLGLVIMFVLFGLLLFIRWLCRRYNFKQFLFGLACFITLIALFYAEEDWRGWHAWNKFKQEWEAKGEHFDFASMVPPAVPDEQNFALTPIAFTSYGSILTREGKLIPYEQRDTNSVERIHMGIAHYDNWPTNGTGNWQKSTAGDLTVWQNYYRALAATTNEFAVPPQPQSPAADVLLALSKYDSPIEELRAASRLPGSRFPLNYDSESPSAILLPHLSALKKCSQTLQLRSLAELQNGQPEKALADVKLALQLSDKIRTEPFLISHLVRIAMLQIMLQPVYEGLAERRWSEEQLVALDAELAKLDFVADYQLSMRGELGCQGGEMNRLRRHPELLHDMGGWSGGEEDDRNPSLPGKIIAHLIPTGWFYQNQFRCARMMVDYYLPVANVNQGTFSPALIRRGDAVLTAETKTAGPFNVLERLMLPGIGAGARRFAYAQSSVNLARTAIALERYRLVRGAYPESLDALTLQFIAKPPHDVINGQPLHYRLKANGQFILYSVGWNETDDGGQVGRSKNGNVDINTGDWVWRYPAR
jgi:hypothetical protein